MDDWPGTPFWQRNYDEHMMMLPLTNAVKSCILWLAASKLWKRDMP